MKFISYWEFEAVNLDLVKVLVKSNERNQFVINFHFSVITQNNEYTTWNFSDKEERDFVYDIIMKQITAFPIQHFEEPYTD